MEKRNGEADKSTPNKNISPFWGSSHSSHLAPMAENHHFNQYYFPFIEEDHQPQQPPLNVSPMPTPNSLVTSFNRMSLNNPGTRPPVIENPVIDPWRFDPAYLLEVIKNKNAVIRQMEIITQGFKPSSSPYDGGFDPYLVNDPYSKLIMNGVGGGDTIKCTCSACQNNVFYPKRRYGREDEYDYLNMNRLQLSSSNPQFQMLMNTPKFNSLEEVRGSMVLLAKDQHGCRFLQKKIEGGRKDDIDMIFLEIKDAISDLMVDQFGNYLVQKLIDTCNGDQRNDILITLTRREHVLVKICCDMHGTRAIQKLLERLTNEQQQARIISALTPGTVVLTTDINGHHVIQYCVKHFPIELKKYLLDAVAAHCVEIAIDRSGCCVLQLCVEHSHGEIRERLVAEITNNALVLAQDPYGNYVVQYLLGLKKPQYTAKLLRKLEGSYVSLSMQKFSSNVVERCLKESSEDQATQIVKELVSNPDVLKLLQDAYGNYVIQSALAVSYKTRAFFALVDLVKIHDTSLRSHPYGKRILHKIDQLTK